MQVTTTPSIEGRKITRYWGVVAGEAILGANLFKDLFAGIRDLVGGRSAETRRWAWISTTKCWARVTAC